MIEQEYTFDTFLEAFEFVEQTVRKLDLWKERYIGSDYEHKIVPTARKVKVQVKIRLFLSY